jgi:hypothetical protein
MSCSATRTCPEVKNQVDRRPTVPNDDRQAQSVHTSRHVYIGKYDHDQPIGFEMHDSFVGRCSVQCIEAGVFKYDGRAYSEERFVFDDENQGPAHGVHLSKHC